MIAGPGLQRKRARDPRNPLVSSGVIPERWRSRTPLRLVGIYLGEIRRDARAMVADIEPWKSPSFPLQF
jgi:hypothetical protein